jgi:uncharacterized protein (TIGR02302 family)
MALLPREHRTEADIYKAIRWPLRLTHWGMVAERVTRAFWPLWSVIFVALGLLMLGVQDELTVEWVWAIGAGLGIALIWALVRGVRRFRWPPVEEALVRLDATLTGNPIQAALDHQAIGAEDAGSGAVWKAHQARMRAKLKEARAAEPDLSVAKADPFALRYMAVLTLSVALLFGSFMRVQSVTTMGAGGPDLAQGPTWEGWMEPPSYTRLPSIYLNDIIAPSLDVPEGAQITLRMYGEVGALTVTEDVSGRPIPEEGLSDTAQEFEVVRSGALEIDGPGGRLWQIALIPDGAPTVARDGDIDVSYEGEAEIPFAATDDHGVTAGMARFALALDEVDRRYGRAIEPEARPVLEVPLPMPISGSRSDFSELLVENFSLHPWANLPVRLELEVEDARGQLGLSKAEVLTLPGRRFFDPIAAAVIEQRQALLWNRDNGINAALILRAILHRSEAIFRKPEHGETLRGILQDLEQQVSLGLTDEQQEDLSQRMWDLALELEEGDLQDALERLQRAQDRLAEAMKNGASDQEIAELMQELREATDDYLRQLAQQQRQQAEENPEMQQQGDPQNMMEMSQNDLQEMMDRIQELMEQGRMAEAMEALEQLRQMMENMQVTEGQGQGGQSPGEQAMEGLSETLREQQGLSDEAFRDLQEQFNQGQQPGQQGEGQQQQGQGQGEAQGEQQGQGQGSGQQEGQGQQRGADGGQGGDGQSLEESLADRQQALRDELNRQRRNLPGQGTEQGDAAAEALRRAEEAMDGAEEALRDGDLADAIGRQSEAMEALREGLRNLGEALAQQQQQKPGPAGYGRRRRSRSAARPAGPQCRHHRSGRYRRRPVAG